MTPGAAGRTIVSIEATAETLAAAARTGNGPARSAWVLWVSSVLLILSAAALCASLVIGTYNVRYSFNRIWEIALGDAATAGASGRISAILSIPQWVRPFMQDLSLVTPGLAAFTSSCMLLSAVLLIWFPASAARLSSIHFPFPAGYKTYYVQLGLLGTIIGFVIAFSDVEIGAERQAMILVEALGTALWSTLTAILLAYGVCPLVELVYQRLRWPQARVATDTRSALEVLRQRTVDAADSLATLSDSANALSGDLSVRSLHGRIGRLEDALAHVAEGLEQLGKMARELKDRQEETECHARMTESWVETTEQRLTQLDEHVQDLGRSLSSLAATVDDLGASAARLQEEDIPTQSERIAALEQRVITLVKTLKTALE